MTLGKFFNPSELVSFPQENKGQMSYHLQKKHLINCKLLDIKVLGANNLAKKGYNGYQILKYFYANTKFARINPEFYK